MGLDRRLGDMEPLTDPGVTQPLAHQREYGVLPTGERLVRPLRRPHNGHGPIGRCRR